MLPARLPHVVMMPPLPCICAVQCTTRQRQLQIMGHTADRVLMGREIHTHLGHSWGRVRLRWLRTTPLAFAFRRLRPATFLWLSHRWTDAAGVTPALPRCTNDTTPTIPHQPSPQHINFVQQRVVNEARRGANFPQGTKRPHILSSHCSPPFCLLGFTSPRRAALPLGSPRICS